MNDVNGDDLVANDLVGELIVSVFRLNGRLIETGNELVLDLGLTSAWWQVLGALSLSPAPIPVAHIARNMGLSRQAVQRNVDLLAERGMVGFTPNPHHQRAKLVVLTPKGAAAVGAAKDRQRPLARRMADSIGEERIATALDVLGQIEALLSRAGACAEGPTQGDLMS